MCSGTGFFIAADILKGRRRLKVAPAHRRTSSFRRRHIIDGVRISYCPTAVFHDEQPITFPRRNQRLLAKGF